MSRRGRNIKSLRNNKIIYTLVKSLSNCMLLGFVCVYEKAKKESIDSNGFILCKHDLNKYIIMLKKEKRKKEKKERI